MNELWGRNRRTIAVATGTRAEYGLLKPVMRAIASHPALQLQTLVTGAHLLPPSRTIDEVAEEFTVAATVPMQSRGWVGRQADACALGRGISGFAELFAHNAPDVVLVLGDRIEAFAAAAAAAVAGVRVAHMHGGDRAEGIADDSLRHAITKLAHIHLPATSISAQRIIAMGEDPQRVHVVGSPAIDNLAEIPAIDDAEYEALGSPRVVVLLHPNGEEESLEYKRAMELLFLAQDSGPTLALHPNFDSPRDAIVRAIEVSGCAHRSHLRRELFVGLLRRAAVLVGNSSAGLIECAAIPVWCVNVGTRQAGREMPGHVINIPDWDLRAIRAAIAKALSSPRPQVEHPYGDGRTGQRVADLLATPDLEQYPIKKRNMY